MRVFLLVFAFLITACAAPVADEGSTPLPNKAETHSANVHIPPPGFEEAGNNTGKICGGMTAGPNQTCTGKNEYCHREIKDLCGAADAPGRCRVKPQACTMDYTPVCGCDGKTYPNECAANANGISASYAGECKP